MKFVELVPVPPGPVTEIGPVVAPSGTAAVIRVADTTVKVVDSPFTLTAVAPVKPVPVSVTVLVTHPLEGENEVMEGGGAVTVKLVLLVPVPEAEVTEMEPVVAPVGTVAVICVAELTVKVAVVPANCTDDAPVKLAPVMTTDVPGGPLVGVNPLMVGAGWVVTLKLVELVAIPWPGTRTLIGPSVAPAGTVVVICVSETTVKVARLPLKRTRFAPVKPVPVTVTLVPTGPLAGLKPVIVGAAAKADGVTSRARTWTSIATLDSKATRRTAFLEVLNIPRLPFVECLPAHCIHP